MNADLARARQLLGAEQLTLAVVRGDELWTSTARGLATLLAWQADPDVDLAGASAADLVVGKAAALLYVAAGVETVWAQLMSQTAVDVFTAHGIAFDAEQHTAVIRNRAGDGCCPMELAVQRIDDPVLAPRVLRERIASLKAAPAGA